MPNENPYFLLIPAVHMLIALSLVLIALTERELRSARYGAGGFVLAALSLFSDTLREPGEQNWMLWLGVATHYAAVVTMLAAFLARKRVAVPRMTLAITLGGSIALLPHVPWELVYPLRPVIMTAIGAAIILSALPAVRARESATLIDRAVWYVTLAAGISYLGRTAFGWAHIHFNHIPNTPEALTTIVLAFHISGAITGFLVGIVLILTIGYDLLALRSEEAERDPLTGLWNRRRLDRLLREAPAAAEQIGAVIVVDLDRFKAINDRFGHEAGDEVLRRVARTLDRLLAPYGTVCRMGGEEFVAVIEPSSAEAASALAVSVRKGIAAITFDGLLGEVGVTASVGYCPLTADLSAREAVRRADQAVYAAKADGRNRVMGSVMSNGLQVLKAVA